MYNSEFPDSTLNRLLQAKKRQGESYRSLSKKIGVSHTKIRLVMLGLDSVVPMNRARIVADLSDVLLNEPLSKAEG